MKIFGMSNITNTDAEVFYNDLTNAINVFQDDNQLVDVQYQVNTIGNNQVLYSALIIGRKTEVTNTVTTSIEYGDGTKKLIETLENLHKMDGYNPV